MFGAQLEMVTTVEGPRTVNLSNSTAKFLINWRSVVSSRWWAHCSACKATKFPIIEYYNSRPVSCFMVRCSSTLTGPRLQLCRTERSSLPVTILPIMVYEAFQTCGMLYEMSDSIFTCSEFFQLPGAQNGKIIDTEVYVLHAVH